MHFDRLLRTEAFAKGAAAACKPLIAVARSARRAFLRIRRDESGSYLTIAGLLMPILTGVLGLGTETGVWFLKHRNMQSAADSAAVSAATAYYVQGSATNLAVEARAVAVGYRLVHGTDGLGVTVNHPPSAGPNMSTAKAVEVIISQPQQRLFTALWNSSPLTISARSVAVGTGGRGCVISLDPTAGGATTTQGTAQVVLTKCSLYDNSTSTSALTVGGSSTLAAETVNVVGQISGQSAISAVDGIYTGQQPIVDPYADASFPTFSGCKEHNYTAKNTVTITPGVYCGGISLNAGATVTLSPGIYYLDQGSLSVNGGATLTGSGVTLVFTSSNGRNYASATINGGANINLSAPTDGPTAGIVIFGDQLMTVGTSFKLNGGSSEVFKGAVYVPRGAVTFAGGADSTNGCLQLIANTITFVGNSNFAVNCTGSGTRPIGSALARLVE